MGNSLKFNSPIPPSVNKYLDKHIRRKGRNYTQLGFEKSHDTLVYENHMRNLFHKLKRIENWETPSEDKFFTVDLTYYMYKKGMDPDNTLKLLLDNMVHNGIIPNDSQVLVRMNGLYIDSINPRIEVELNVMDKIGVFDNTTQLTEFKIKNCHKCKKHYYKKQCSCLTKLLGNYLNDNMDLENMACNKIKVIGD